VKLLTYDDADNVPAHNIRCASLVWMKTLNI